MTATTQEAIDRGLEFFLALVRENAALNAEFEASLSDFFGGAIPVGDARETLLAARRHLEWFVLERHSPSLLGTPVEKLLDAWAHRAGGGISDHSQALLSSFTGAFEVTDVYAEEGMWLRDLAGLGEYPVAEPEGAGLLETGDLIVGRLFPTADGWHHVSRCAGFIRNPDLFAALEHDLAQLREQGGHGAVLHISQHEIERMFFGVKDAPANSDPVGEARTLLDGAGVDRATIERVLQQLANCPFDGDRLVHGAQDPLADLLDELAFGTEVDLTEARRLLVHAWQKLAHQDTVEQETRNGSVPAGPEAALAAFDRGRAAGADLDVLIANLERDLELDDGPDLPDDADETDEEPTPAPDFPGVVGAMVDEFLWETGATHGAARAQRFEPLRKLGRFGERIGHFESLTARDLLQFAAFWLPEQHELRTGAEARDLVEALDAFCEWTQEAHDLPLQREFAAQLGGLRDSLPRVTAANLALRAVEDGETGELLEFLGVQPGGESRLRTRDGDERTIALEAELTEWLHAGDRLRGRVALDGSVVVYRCYPPEAAGLLGA